MAYIVNPGIDSSGNGNDWLPVNINYTTSTVTTYDIMSDVPTLTDEDTSNFCTINPITCPEGTISNGSLTIDHNGSAGRFYLGTMGMPSGKWYFEAKVLNMSSNSRHTIGFCKAHESYQSFRIYMGGSSSTYHCLFYSGAQYEGTTIARTISSLAQPASGTIINVAIDVDNNKVFFGKNGTWQNSGDPVAGTGQCINLAANTEWVLATGAADNSSNSIHNNDWDFNFGQQPFAYTPPTGYKKLNTYNLPDSTIKDGSQYMNTVTYTGNGSTNAITGVGFSPDLVWIKCRSILSGSITGHQLLDTIRGASNELSSHTTNAEGILNNALYGDMTSFDSDGFTVTDGTDPNNDTYNGSGDSYVAWNWRASDSSPVSNTDGTITSTVSANTTSGFSIVSYVSNGTNTSTVGHGLSQKPDIVIQKNRTNASDWLVQTQLIDGSNDYLLLNTTAAAASAANGANATTFGSWDRPSGNNMIAYCFAPVEGFSKFGSYTGNGSTDGPFIYTGFRPAFVMVKRTDSTTGADWFMWDAARLGYNVSNYLLFANLTQTEYSGHESKVDLLSNGFKIRDDSTAPGSNASGGTYIYMAFASNPFKNSLAR